VSGNRPKIVIAGGGTGGHVFPAIAVADEMRRRRPGASIGFIGGRRGLENRLVPDAGYRLRTLPLSGLKGVGIGKRFRATAEAAWGLVRCLGWMLAERPRLVIGVGGYASGPAVLAARILGVATMVIEQNHFPGATNRWLASRVDAVCVPSEAARDRLGGRGIVTGNPVRPEFSAIGEPPGGPRVSVLVCGGSRGAHSINRAVVAALPRLAAMTPPPRIVHQTGSDDLDTVSEAFRKQSGIDAWEVHAFLEDMPRRLAEADLVVGRAGATTLAELAAAGRAAILIPFPHAADDHQRLNAEEVERAGAASVLLDRDLDGASLAARIGEIARDAERRRRMGRAARLLARPDAASRIADDADALIERRSATEGADVS